MSKDVYNPKFVEERWQAEWQRRKTFAAQAEDPRPSFYSLEMFPYPSGNLHMGHVRNYTLGDVVARYQRMRGKNVLHPIGWDAFGLPAENAAIKHNVHPEQWTRQNIATMRDQLKALGIAYDWDREFATCDRDYYRWNQWFFIQFFKRGLVYKKKAPVNWCPSCQTVLANEQVSATGQCWRCDSHVELKELSQWFIKITAYADALLRDHEQLRGRWPEEVLSMQSHWIGRSDGANVIFPVQGRSETLTVFTTRPDTLFGATYLALAPEHPLAVTLATQEGQKTELDRLIAIQRARKRDRQETPEKNGFFLGAYAINPINQKPTPIWVADYVLMDYGTGAIMAVPAHDQRDFEFATRYQIPIIPVIQGPPHPSPSPARGEGKNPSPLVGEGLRIDVPMTDRRPLQEVGRGGRRPDEGGAYEGEGVLINSGEFDGIPSTESKRKIGAWLKAKKAGEPTVTFKLRDWLVSRQRYWGTPIPMLTCATCGLLPVAEKDLPVVLPTDVTFTGAGESPLAQSAAFVNTPCPQCGGPAKRETDTMDTFVDSSWYYARYTDARNAGQPFDPRQGNTWLPVNQYIGGIEHACMHLIYSRFWHKAMKDLGLVTTDEPFARLLAQGMVTLGGVAMSKSRGNVVDPNAIIAKYGADTARLFILFAAPPEKQLEWNDEAVEGMWRFLNRVWRLVNNVQRAATDADSHRSEEEPSLRRKLHWAIDKVSRDYGDDKIQINTAIAAVMELVNELYAYPALGDSLSQESTRTVVQLLAPVAPHLMEELWSLMGGAGLVAESSWPTANPAFLVSNTVEIVVQINGKLRARLSLPTGLTREEVERRVQADDKVRAALKGLTLAKVIVIPDKLVNLVAR